MKKIQPWLSLAARLILGGTLIAAGYLKFDELDKSQMAVRAYEMLPISLANFLGIVVPFFELAVGILLVIGAGVRISAALSALLMIAFMIQSTADVSAVGEKFLKVKPTISPHFCATPA
jgi:uncharacterized membrane protein YphA (DoxX/SURF4 family)